MSDPQYWEEGVWLFTFRPGRFTAKLKTRISVEEDWSLLGRVAARVGVPRDCPMPPTFYEEPEAEHVWEWTP